jgi:deoxyguanosine kinase
MNFQPPRYIAIEGPIRVGKSSLARMVADRLRGRAVHDTEQNPFLKEFYEERPGAALRAQMYFLLERFRQLREIDPARSRTTIVADYLFEKDKIFACINLSDEELRLYDGYYELLRTQAPTPDLVIYLQAPPAVLRERIARKSRQMGSRVEMAISQEYLEEVVRAYEHFFFHYKASHLLVINTAEIDFVERREDLEELLRRLTQPVKGTQYFLPLGSGQADPQEAG